MQVSSNSSDITSLQTTISAIIEVGTISDGDTSRSPSSDDVFDALTTKQDLLNSSVNIDVGFVSASELIIASQGVQLGSPAGCGATEVGTLRANSSTGAPEYCDGADWVAVVGGGGGGIESCPAGMTMVGDSGKRATYCIDTNENPADEFYDADSACYGRNDAALGRAHICTYTEWFTACNQRVALGTQNMTNNDEWIGSAGAAQIATLGNGNCYSGNYFGATNQKAYRCCY
jgi:hypothetical protein